MAEFNCADSTRPLKPITTSSTASDSIPAGGPAFLPVWARSHVQYAQNLLECNDEPIEYFDDDEDYRDNCFFFPEDCVYYSPKYQLAAVTSNPDAPESESSDQEDSTGDMPPMLPSIKMLDPSALSDLLADNLSPPEITSILISGTNGSIFAHASPYSQRELRNLTAVYGAAYTSYAVNSSKGNLTGVNPASHPSSFITAPSIPLGDVGSIIFELEDQGQVAVVTKIADKVLLAVVGPTRIDPGNRAVNGSRHIVASSAASDRERGTTTAPDSLSSTFDQSTHDSSAKFASSAPNPCSLSNAAQNSRTRDPSLSSQEDADDTLRAQWEIDRKHDLDRLASLNLASSPSILLALESKSAALGRFLSNKLADLENPEDF